VPQLPQAGYLYVRGTPLLEDSYRLQGLSVLRLDQQARWPLHLPRLRGSRVLTKPRLLEVLLPAAGLGVLVGALARSTGEAGWIFALLVGSAVATAIAQQTLPWGPNAVYGIASSDVHRNQAGRSWQSKAAVYALASAVAGLVAGAALGLVGGFLPLEVRLGVGSILAIVAIAVGGLELFGRRIQPLQIDCETPQRWVNKGPWRWATRNGLTLGFGATTRIGFWLWYVIPLGAFLVGEPVAGAIIYGTYGLVRALGAVAIILAMMRLDADISDRVLEGYNTARIFTAGQLVFLGVATAIVVGL
jgi:hypothetical protein